MRQVLLRGDNDLLGGARTIGLANTATNKYYINYTTISIAKVGTAVDPFRNV